MEKEKYEPTYEEVKKADESMTHEEKIMSKEREETYTAGTKKVVEEITKELEYDSNLLGEKYKEKVAELVSGKNSYDLYTTEDGKKVFNWGEYGYRPVYEILQNKDLGLDFFKKMDKADLAKIICRQEDKSYIDKLLSLFSKEDIEDLYFNIENCVDKMVMIKTEIRVLELLGSSDDVKSQIKLHEGKNENVKFSIDHNYEAEYRDRLDQMLNITNG